MTLIDPDLWHYKVMKQQLSESPEPRLLALKENYSLLATECGIVGSHFPSPMTPQATRAPALPVVLLSSCPPLPKSSESACT